MAHLYANGEPLASPGREVGRAMTHAHHAADRRALAVCHELAAHRDFINPAQPR